MWVIKNTWIIAGGLWAWYLGLETLKQSGYETASAIQWAIDNVAEWVNDLLWDALHIQIPDFAPLSQLGIDELVDSLTSASLSDFVASGWFGLAGGYLWGKATDWVWKITNTESTSDTRVWKVGAWLTAWLGTLWATTVASTIWAGTVGYILGKKLSQTILKEEHAKIIWYLTGALSITTTWGVNSGTVLWTALLLWWGKMIWDTGKPLREKNRAKLEEKKRIRAEKRKRKQK